MKQEKIKLTFHRCNYGEHRPQYRLDQIENAVTAELDFNGNKSVHRVGEVLPEATVREFAEIKRDFIVKVNS